MRVETAALLGGRVFEMGEDDFWVELRVKKRQMLKCSIEGVLSMYREISRICSREFICHFPGIPGDVTFTQNDNITAVFSKFSSTINQSFKNFPRNELQRQSLKRMHSNKMYCYTGCTNEI